MYKRTEEKEINTFSTLLTPSIIQQTEVVKLFKNNQVVQTDSTILILQLKTDAVPSLIDSQEYRNGKKTRAFSNLKRRQELDY